jgi:Ricin-type beta-trefoil lectin domain
VIRRLRLPGLVAATVVPLLAVLLPPASARAAGPGDGAFYAVISNVYDHDCVNVRNDSTAAGAWIQQYFCDNTPATKFYFTAAGPAGSYEILGQNSHLCITPLDNPAHDGTQLIQWYCVGAQSQLWQLLPAGAGSYELYNSASGLCMAVPGWSSDYWVILQVKACNYAGNQDWNLYTS